MVSIDRGSPSAALLSRFQWAYLKPNNLGTIRQRPLVHAKPCRGRIRRQKSHHAENAQIARVPALNRYLCLQRRIRYVGSSMVKGSGLGHERRFARGRLSNPGAWAGVEVIGYRGCGLAWAVLLARRSLRISSLERCRAGELRWTRLDTEQGAVARKYVEREEDGERDGARSQEDGQFALQTLPRTGLRVMSKKRA